MKFPVGYPINKIKNEEQRPFWSVMIPTYNTPDYLVETLKCVLEQDMGAEQMQIMVVDDASTQGNTAEIVQEIGQGRIEFYRQPENLGQTGNWNSCLELAKGYWIHLLHDDDLVLPGFYRKLETALRTNEEIGAAFCRVQIINQDSQPKEIWQCLRQTAGILENWLEFVAVYSMIQPPSIVVKREVYERLGGFHQDLSLAADWEMWQRIAVFYPFWYEPEVLACYRDNPLKEHKASGKNLIMFRRSIEIAESYLPPEKNLTEKARNYWAKFALRRAYRMLLQKDLEAVGNILREGLNLSASPEVLEEWMSLFSRSYPYDFTGIPSWENLPNANFSLEKATAMQKILKKFPSNCRILELGAFEGRSSVAMAWGLSAYSKLTCVIPLPELQKGWGNTLNEEKVVASFDQVLKQFGCRDKVRILATSIAQAENLLQEELFEMIFLNLPCSYYEALSYLQQWYPKIIQQGLLVCNYYEMRYPGIIRATQEMDLKGNQIVAGLWVHEKVR